MGRDYEKVREHEHQRDWVAQILAQVQSSEWFGTLTVKIEKGVIKRVMKEESILPPPLGEELTQETTKRLRQN